MEKHLLKYIMGITVAIVFSFSGYAWGGSCQTQVIQTKKPCAEIVPLSNVKTPWGPCPQYNFWNCAGDKDCDCIPDERDRCPMDKENYNGVDDRDGCPEEIIRMVVIDKKSMARDSDNDGITDDRDRCPFEAGSPDNDGCPISSEVSMYKKYPIVKGIQRGFLIHVSSYRGYEPAVDEIQKLWKEINPGGVYIRKVTIKGKRWFRTFIGPFNCISQSKKALAKLKRYKWISSPRIVSFYELYVQKI